MIKDRQGLLSNLVFCVWMRFVKREGIIGPHNLKFRRLSLIISYQFYFSDDHDQLNLQQNEVHNLCRASSEQPITVLNWFTCR